MERAWGGVCGVWGVGYDWGLGERWEWGCVGIYIGMGMRMVWNGFQGVWEGSDRDGVGIGMVQNMFSA